MPRKKVKFEFRDDEDNKYIISLEGIMSKEKLSRIIDIINEIDKNDVSGPIQLNLNTIFNKILKLVEDKFPLGSFTSNDLLEAYEDTYNTPIKLSTVSTYLARLAERGLTTREQIGNNWVYRRNKIILSH